MGPGGPQSAALVISECQLGILDPAASVTPALAAQAAERGIVAHIAELADAFRAGWPLARIYELSAIDPWFLEQIAELVREETRVRDGGLAELEHNARNNRMRAV